MENILEIRGVTGGYIPEVQILQGVDLALHKGETVGIIGLNGSGKSTLGKSVMNMIPHRDGEITYKGRSIVDLTTSQLSRLGIGIMQQGGQVFLSLSAWDNLQLAFGDQRNNDYLSELKAIIPLVGMQKKDLKALMADKLSGGQRHQLALAMVIASKPDLLILDEPSAGLSPKAVDEMYTMLTQIREKYGVTILLIEQNISKAIEFCNHCYLIRQGHITHKIENKDILEVENLMFK